jgi:hypothetical protein
MPEPEGSELRRFEVITGDGPAALAAGGQGADRGGVVHERIGGVGGGAPAWAVGTAAFRLAPRGAPKTAGSNG